MALIEENLNESFPKMIWLGDEFKYQLVSWSNVCTPIAKGGLGIRNLLSFNHALLGK
jgi:hypothetical protein